MQLSQIKMTLRHLRSYNNVSSDIKYKRFFSSIKCVFLGLNLCSHSYKRRSTLSFLIEDLMWIIDTINHMLELRVDTMLRP